jgi:hypothetical protein
MQFDAELECPATDQADPGVVLCMGFSSSVARTDNAYPNSTHVTVHMCRDCPNCTTPADLRRRGYRDAQARWPDPGATGKILFDLRGWPTAEDLSCAIGYATTTTTITTVAPVSAAGAARRSGRPTKTFRGKPA